MVFGRKLRACPTRNAAVLQVCRVLQVKNFGRSGRTKYTHLVDQDTTQFDAAWADNSALNIKFHSQISAGMRQSFDRPSANKRK